VSAALRRYQIMARIVGVGLLLLVGVGVPLRYGAGQPVVVSVLGPLHGLLYIVYLMVALDLGRQAELTNWELVAIAAAGLFPFLTFYLERRTTRRVTARLSATQTRSPSLG
jgi:integral membrane protein